MVVNLESMNPGTKIMLHDEAAGCTQIICTDCWHTWVVDHDAVLELPDDAPPVSQCPACGPMAQPMNVSTEIGHA
jgi:hypothetical protein